MIIIYGHRFFGKVDEHGGQFAATRFFHIWYLPIAPDRAFWSTRPAHGGLVGHRIRMRGRNVLAGYARVWGPVGAIASAMFLAGGSIAAAPIGAAFAAAGVWSFARKRLRGAREQKRSDLHLAAFGTRCDPLDWPDEMAAQLRPVVEERWARVAGGKTPEDIASRGTDDPRQAIAAYGVLRLAARDGAHAAAARAASEKVLDGTGAIDGNALEGGPYRSLETPG